MQAKHVSGRGRRQAGEPACKGRYLVVSDDTSPFTVQLKCCQHLEVVRARHRAISGFAVRQNAFGFIRVREQFATPPSLCITLLSASGAMRCNAMQVKISVQ